MRSEKIPVSELCHGDTVLIDGEARTLSREDIKRCAFMGVSVLGRRLSHCERVLFPKWHKGEIINYQPQI